MRIDGDTLRPPLPVLLGTAAAIVLLIGLHLAADIVALVVFSVIATVVLVPLATGLRRRGAPGWLAMLIAIVVYVVVLGGAGLLVAVGLVGFLRDLPTYRDELAAALEQLGADLGGPGASVPIDPDAVAGAVRSIAASLTGTIIALGYSVFVVAYLLLEAPQARRRLGWAFGPDSAVIERGERLAERLRTYVVARAILGAVAAVLDVILLVVLGVPAALLWGVLSFLLSFIPNVGFILALIPPAILGLLVGGLGTAVAVVIGYSVINIAIDDVVQPRYIGTSVDLSAIVVTIVLLFWGLILGGPGALLAVPLTLVAVALLDAFDATRPAARLMAERIGDGVLSPEPREDASPPTPTAAAAAD